MKEIIIKIFERRFNELIDLRDKSKSVDSRRIISELIIEYANIIQLIQSTPDSKEYPPQPISDAIEFAEWIRVNMFEPSQINEWLRKEKRGFKYYTTKELYEIFKTK